MSGRNSTFRGRGSDGQRGTRRGRGARSGRDAQSSPKPPVGELIKTIASESAETGDEEHCGITKVELVASYNWIDGPGAKIVVPGKPRLWTPLEGPRKLHKDRGVFYRDRNAASYPSHPMEPAVVSVLRMHPEPLSVDVVGCSRTLDALLRHVRGTEQPFRMLVEVVGKTVHLIGRENSPTEEIPRTAGYGHTFREAYTSWEPGFERSLSHQRILGYRLGGLDLLVRYEADGYVGAGQPTPTARAPGQTGSLRLGQDGSSMAGLQVASAGGPTSQDSVMDIKARSIRAKGMSTLSEQMPRLWVRQVPKLAIAHHNRGLFEDVQVHDVSTGLQEWEAENQTHLRQLVALLRRLGRDAMADKGRLELVRNKGGELELRRSLPDAGTAFSPSVSRQWGGWLDEGRKKGGAGHESFDGDGWSDDGEYRDLTACDRECGYCGRCMY